MAVNKHSTSSSDVNQDIRLQSDEPSQSATPIDGRWAVVVVIAGFIGRAIVALQSSSMPMLTVEWEKRLGATPSQVSWATTLVVSPRFLIAPVAGALNRRFGCRPIVFVGGLLAMTSILLLSVTNKLCQILLCCSIIGISMGLVYQGTVIVVSVYFDKWLGRANGFAYSGVGIGIMVGSPLVALLIDVFTWRGALLVVAGIVANLSVTAAVYRPLTWWSKRKCIPKQCNELGQQMNGCEGDIYPGSEEMQTADNEDPFQDVCHDPEDIFIYPEMHNENVKQDKETKEDVQCNELIGQFQTEASSHHDANTGSTRFANIRLFIKTTLDLFGFNLLWTNSNVFLLCLLSIFQGAGYFTPYLYLPSYIVSSGVSELRASFILTILGSCSLVGRLTHGFLIDYKLTTPPKLYGFAAVLAGFSCYIIVFSGSYQAFIVYAVGFGLFTGALIPLSPVMTKKYTAPSQLANAFGLQNLFVGISQLLGTYLLGLIFNWTKNYRLCYCLTGALLCISGVIAFLIEPWNRRKHRHRLRNQ